jgi:hypothetical protein
VNDLRRAHDLALSRRELLASLSNGRSHALPPALRESATQNSHQFRLRRDIEFLGGVKYIIKRCLLVHGNLVSIILPASVAIDSTDTLTLGWTPAESLRCFRQSATGVGLPRIDLQHDLFSVEMGNGRVNGIPDPEGKPERQ